MSEFLGKEHNHNEHTETLTEEDRFLALKAAALAVDSTTELAALSPFHQQADDIGDYLREDRLKQQIEDEAERRLREEFRSYGETD